MNLIDLMETSQIIYDTNDLYIIWKDIVLDERLDKDVLISEIMKECGSMTPYYNVVKVFKKFSDMFFLKWKHEITKLTDTLYFKYTPIWNKDGKIKENWNRNLGENEFFEKEKEIVSENNIENNMDTSSENKTSAYNVNNYSDNDITYNNTIENENENKEIKEGESNGRDRKEKEKYNSIIIEQGNIGVTSTQSLIREERQLMEFNIYQWIVHKYCAEMMLQVY